MSVNCSPTLSYMHVCEYMCECGVCEHVCCIDVPVWIHKERPKEDARCLVFFHLFSLGRRSLDKT